MSHSREQLTTVIAVIPHHSDPSLRIVDDSGNYPSVTHTGGETYEAAFRRIGTEKLGVGALSVAFRLADMEGPDDIAYQAKPLGQDPHPDSGYFWKALP